MPRSPKKKAAPGRQMRVGNARLQFGRNLGALSDSSPLLRAGDWAALRQRLAEEGVLLLRGAVPAEDALGARRRILEHLRVKGAVDTARAPLDKAVMARCPETGRSTEGWCVDAESGGVVGDRDDDVAGWREVGNSAEVTRAYHGPGLRRLFGGLFGERHVAQPGFTWLRMKGRGDSTVEHADYYYFKGSTDLFGGNRAAPPREDFEGLACEACGSARDDETTLVCDLCDALCHVGCASPPLDEAPDGEWHCAKCADAPLDVFTCWVALGEVRYTNGMLALVPRTHTQDGYDRPLAGRQLPAEWGGRERAAQWQTAEMGPGDAILFNIKTVHGASVNTSSSFRLSFDTRVVARPLDPRGAGARFATPAALRRLAEEEEAAAAPAPAAAAGKIAFRQQKKRERAADDADGDAAAAAKAKAGNENSPAPKQRRVEAA